MFNSCTQAASRVHLEGLKNEISELEIGLKAAQEVVSEGGLAVPVAAPVAVPVAAPVAVPVAAPAPTSSPKAGSITEPSSPPPPLPAGLADSVGSASAGDDSGGSGSGTSATPATTPPPKSPTEGVASPSPPSPSPPSPSQRTVNSFAAFVDESVDEVGGLKAKMAKSRRSYQSLLEYFLEDNSLEPDKFFTTLQRFVHAVKDAREKVEKAQRVEALEKRKMEHEAQRADDRRQRREREAEEREEREERGSLADSSGHLDSPGPEQPHEQGSGLARPPLHEQGAERGGRGDPTLSGGSDGARGGAGGAGSGSGSGEGGGTAGRSPFVSADSVVSTRSDGSDGSSQRAGSVRASGAVSALIANAARYHQRKSTEARQMK